MEAAAKKLRDTTGGDGVAKIWKFHIFFFVFFKVYAVTLTAKHSLEELLEYTGSEGRVYTDARTDVFIREMANVIRGCHTDARVKPVSEVEATTS